MLRKNKNSVYFCSNFDSSAKRQKCPNTTRWTVVGQGEDKFDFKLMMNNTRKSDAGMYELELRMADVGGSISIYRNYSLLVSDGELFFCFLFFFHCSMKGVCKRIIFKLVFFFLPFCAV